MAFDYSLWERIETLSFDHPEAQFFFADRLARDNGWSRDFADRVVTEYKRFAYLAVTTGHEVTPSDEVDQAWHLHLTYTHHYWGPFTDALGQQLHHGPTIGGPVERTRYADNYANTLSSYESAFNDKPPIDIWPAAAIRFGDAPYMQRVNLRDQKLTRKSKWPARSKQIAFAMTLGLAGFTGAATANETGKEWLNQLTQNPKLLFAGILLMGISLIAGGILSHHAAASSKKSDGGYAPPGTGGDGGDSGCGGGGCGGGGCGGGGGGGCGGSPKPSK